MVDDSLLHSFYLQSVVRVPVYLLHASSNPSTVKQLVGSQKRFQQIDVTKGLAVLSVMLLHAFASENKIYTGSWANPVELIPEQVVKIRFVMFR